METEALEPACDGPWSARWALACAAGGAAAALVIARLQAAGFLTRATGLTVGAGLLGGLGVAGHSAWLHLAGHQREARRLGLRLELESRPRLVWTRVARTQPRKPDATALERAPAFDSTRAETARRPELHGLLRLRLSRNATPAQRERWRFDGTLVRIAGSWANDRIRRYQLRRTTDLAAPLATFAGLLVALPFGSIPVAVLQPLMAASGLFALILAALLSGRWANLELAESSSAERLGRPSFYPRSFRSWPFWAHAYQRSLLDPVLYRRDHRLILSVAGVSGARSILELGSGASVVFEHLPRPRTRRWIHLDADLSALLAARSRGSGPRSVCADARRLPFADGSVDLVVALGLFDSFFGPESEAVMLETKRVLRPGARLLHLQDFLDWPGPDLVIQFNDILARAGRSERVKYQKEEKRLSFPAVSGDLRPRVVGALRQAEKDLPPHLRDRSALLREIVLSGERPAHRQPMECFKLVFQRTLERHGFTVVSMGAELVGELYHSTFLLARK